MAYNLSSLKKRRASSDAEGEFFDFTDTALGVARGAGYAIGDLYGLVDVLSFDVLPDWNVRESLGESTSTTGRLASGVSQFLTGFLVTGGLLGGAARLAAAKNWTSAAKAAGFLSGDAVATTAANAAAANATVAAAGAAAEVATTVASAGRAASIAGSAARGAIVDFAFFDGQEANLSSAVAGTVLENPISEFLATDEDTGEIEGRLKNTLEGLALGGLFDGITAGMSKMRAARAVRAAGDARRLADEAKALKDPAAARLEAEAKRLEEKAAGAAEAASAEGDVAEALNETARKNREAAAANRIAPGGAEALDESEAPELLLGGIGIPEVKEVRERVARAAQIESTPLTTATPGTAVRMNEGSAYSSGDSLADLTAEDAWSPGQPDGLGTFVVERPLGGGRATRIFYDAEHWRGNDDEALAEVAREFSGAELVPVAITDSGELAVADLGADFRTPGRNLTVGERVEREMSTRAVNLTGISGSDSAIAFDRAVERLVDAAADAEDPVTFAQEGAAAARELADMMNADEREIAGIVQRHVKELRSGAEAVDQAARVSVRAKVVMQMTAEDFYDRAMAISGGDLTSDISDEDLVKLLDSTENAAELMAAVRGIRKSFGRALGLQRLNMIDEGDTVRGIVSPRTAAKRVANLQERITQAGGRGSYTKSRAKLISDLKVTLDAMSGAERGTAEFGAAFFNGVSPLRKQRALGKTLEYLYFSMLSGPKTHIVNAVSNMTALLVAPAETAVAGVVDFSFGGGTAGIMKAWDEVASLGSVAMDMMNLRKSKETWASVHEAWTTGNSKILESHAGKNLIELNNRKGLGGAISGTGARESLGSLLGQAAMDGFAGEALEKGVGAAASVISAPTRALAASDELFKQLHFRTKAMTEFKARARAAGMGSDDTANFVAEQMARVVRNGHAYSQATAREAAREEAINRLGDAAADEAAVQKLTDELVKTEFDPTLNSIAELAVDRAEEFTFTRSLDGTGIVDKTGRFFQNLADAHPVMKLFFPFISTPVNILKFAGERTGAPAAMAYTQYGIAKLRALGSGGVVDVNRLLDSSNASLRVLAAGSDEAKAQVAARLATAVGMGTVITTLATNGLREHGGAGIAIYGKGPSDPDERRAWEAAGRQAYSFRIGDTYISYRRLDPFATLIGTIADIATYSHFSKDDESEASMYAAYVAISENFAKKSYLTGAENLLTVLMSGDPEKVKRVVQHTASTLVPSFVGQTNAAGFEDRMLDVRGVVDALAAKTPFWSGRVEARRNVLGEEMRRVEWDSPHAFMARWSPFPVTSEEQGDPIMVELASTGHPWREPARTMTIAGRRHDLLDYENESGQTAKDRFGELRGQVKIGGMTLRQRLTAIINSEQYRSLPKVSADESMTSERVKVLRGIFAMYTAHARRELLKEFPDLNPQSNPNSLFR